MAQMMSSACLKLVARIDERDQDAILSRLDELQAQGVPAQRAQIQAAIDVLTKLQRQAGTKPGEEEDADSKDSSIKKSQARHSHGEIARPGATVLTGEWQRRIRDAWLNEETVRVPLGILSTTKKAFSGALADIKDGRPSRTDGPIDVWLQSDGRLLIADGQHRYVEAAQSGAKDIEVNVLGEGYSDYYVEVTDENGVHAPGATAKAKRSQARDVTDTPEFKRWFGDSKVVDANGKPLVVYHGGANSSVLVAPPGDGIFFTSSRSIAKEYSDRTGKPDQTVTAAYLSIERPLIVNSQGDFWDDISVQSIEIDQAARRKMFGQGMRSQYTTEEIVEAARRAGGYDGVIFMGVKDAPVGRARRSDVYAVFDSAQIKSATGNNGNFDPANPDIRKSSARAAQEDTPKFKRWSEGLPVHDSFADRSSDRGIFKLYHMTTADFDEFKPGGLSPTDSGPAIWLSADPSATSAAFRVGNAERGFREGARTMPVYAKVKNPLVIDDAGMLDYAREAFADGSREFPQVISKGAADALREAGHDSVIFDGPGVGWKGASAEVIVFDGGQVKSITGNSGAFDPNSKNISKSTKRNAMGFYSALAAGIDSMATKAAPAGAWKAQIKGLVNKGAVKQDEVTWSGLEDWMDLQAGKITKEQIAAYLEQGGVQVQETVLGAAKPKPFTVEEADGGYVVLDNNQPAFPNGRVADGPFDEEWEANNRAEILNDDIENGDYEGWGGAVSGLPKYGQYTLPGGTGYREVLLTLPSSTASAEADALQARLDASQLDDLMRGGVQERIDRMRQEAKAKAEYRSTHWDQPNVIAHIRVNDRVDADGNRVLFVEEAQSDWGADGRKKGFASKAVSAEKAGPVKTIPGNGLRDRYEQPWRITMQDGSVEERTLPDGVDPMHGAADKGGPPVGPFVQSTDGWLNLALKRIVAMAVDGGYQKVAFVNGEQSADRYDLSRQVDSLAYNPDSQELVGNKDDSEVFSKSVPQDSLADFVGKEVADRLLKSPKVGGNHFIEGTELKLGGEGMKTFYDSIVPQAVKKLISKMDGKLEIVKFGSSGRSYEQISALLDDYAAYPVGSPEREALKTELDSAPDTGRSEFGGSQPGFAITPKMQEQVSGPGLTLFSRSRGVNEKEPYAADYLGNDLTAQAEEAQSASPAGAPLPDGEYATSAALVVTREQKIGARTINSSQDAANALSYLTRGAVERFDAIVTDAEGGPLSIIGGFKGAISQAAVYPSTLMGEAIQVPGAANIWFVHNHPSGKSALSRADTNLHSTLSNVFDGTGIRPRELLAVAPLEWSSTDGGTGMPEPIENGPAVPVQEREIIKDGLLDLAVTSPQDAKRIAERIAKRNGGRPGLMLMNAQNAPVAYVPWVADGTQELKAKGRLGGLYRAVSESNAATAILVDPGSEFSEDQYKNLAKALTQIDIAMLDVLQGSASIAESIGEVPIAPVLRSRARNPQESTQEFVDWSEGAPVVHLGEEHEFKSGQPVVVEALHGTTNSDLAEFKRERANIESDWGAGFYASNTPDDVAANYANNEGADLTQRIELMSERLAANEFDDDMDAAREEAKRRLSQESPNTLKLYVRMSNPAVQGGKGETFFDYTEGYDEDTDSYGEPNGKLVDFAESLRNVADEFDGLDADAAMAGVWEDAYDGISLTDLVEKLKSSDAMFYVTDDEGNSASTEVIRRALEDMGFDGVIDTTVSTKFKNMKGMNKDTVHFIAFDANQLKSATGNSGAFSRRDNDIRKSTGRTASGADWDSPSASKFDDMVYKLQDKQVDLKRVTEAIKTASGALADDLNVYLQEELYHGRAAKRTEDFVNMELTPLVEQMKADGLEMSDVEEFLHARHAPEANKVIAQRNPGVQDLQDGGSGMKTSDALDYMNNLDPAMKAKLEAAAAKVDAIIKKTREMYVEYELESKSAVDAWDKMFDHYIPLQREDKEAGPGLGQGFSVKGRETKGRTGSTRKVVDILANVAIQREKAIVRGEKNRVSQALVGLAKANPNEGFWTVDEVPTERVFNPKTGLVEDRVDPMYKSRNNAVIAKIADANGQVKEHAVVFNEEDPRALRMAESLKNLDAADLEGVIGVFAKISRYFAATVTQWNPVFGAVNLIRDVQGVALNLSSTPLQGDQGKVMRRTWSAIAGIYSDLRAARKGKSQNSQWAALWDEFQEVGGQTGYRDLFKTSADRGDAIKDALDPDRWTESKLGKIFTAGGLLKVPMAQAKRSAGWIFDWLADYNDAFENGVRLSVYKAGLERGLSKEQAASIAKNASTNFNRKGQVGQQAGAMYAFFNASVQGTARIGQTLLSMEPGKPKSARLSAAGKKIVAGGLMLGTIQAMLLAAAGHDDEDPPQFARERGLIIPIGDKKYITIPMPLGFNVIPNLSRIATEFAMGGFKDPHERALQLFGLVTETFSPIGNSGLSMQTLAPTALDPLVALTENKDWTGKPIARESSNQATPGHALAKDTATTWSKAMSEAINTMSGGNKYTAGVLSPTPDQIDYLLSFLTGGVGKEISKLDQAVTSLAYGEELPPHKIPLAGRFFGNSRSQSSEGSAFYANTRKLNELETEIKGLKEDGKHTEAAELRASRSDAYLIAAANQAERQIQRLRSQKRELIKSDAPRERVKAVEEQITAAMARLNRSVEALEEKSKN